MEPTIENFIKTNGTVVCNSCQKEKKYQMLKAWQKSFNDRLCKKCRGKNKLKLSKPKIKEFKRQCPVCTNNIFYFTEKDVTKANEKKSTCRSCSAKETYKKIGNPMSKGNVYQLWVAKYGKEEADRRESIRAKKQSEKVSKKLKGIPIVEHFIKRLGDEGRAAYEVYIENQKEVQSIIQKERWNKYSDQYKKEWGERYSGEKNPMFGKSPSWKSGIGISGRYNGWYFRSLHELAFMINYIERWNMQWKNGETLRIKYWDNSTERNRTYCPDFILNEKYVIEIKPTRAKKWKINESKKDGAIEYCKQNNMTYKIICPKYLNKDILLNLYESGKIEIQENKKERFEKVLRKIRKEYKI